MVLTVTGSQEWNEDEKERVRCNGPGGQPVME